MFPSPELVHAASGPRVRPRPTTCFGFDVRSALSFRYLRPGSGGSTIEIDELPEPRRPIGDPVRRWIPTAEHPFEAELFAEDDRFLLRVTGTGWYEIDPARPRIRVPVGGDPVRREERTWGFPAALCFTHRGDVPLHAAAVDVGGRALLLAAPGRFGKTTLAASFLRGGHRLLSEDISCCRLSDPATVVPGPAMLRVRHDAYAELELPGTHRVGEDEDRVHLALDLDARGSGQPVPIAGIVLLHRGDGDTSLDRVPAAAALPDLWALSFKLPTDEDRARSFRAIADVAASVPVWRLVRRMRYDEVDALIERLIATCLGDR
jgi:hypothetical protein